MVSLPRRALRLIVVTVLMLTILYVSGMLPSLRKNQPTFVPSSEAWSDWKPKYPPGPIKPLPQGRPKKLPKVQADSSLFPDDNNNKHRREAVRRAFKRSYAAYNKYAWMQDELTPVSKESRNPFGGWAATLVDSLDTLWIMGLKEDFQEAAAAAVSIDWSKTSAGAANMFETTIRHLGGLISAYDLSGERALLDKAVELADMLYVGFDTPNRMPGFWLNFEKAKAGTQQAGTNDPSASPASLCLEFTRLSQITGDPKYYDATDRITRFLERTQKKTQLPGMWPVNLDFRHESADGYAFSLGALADSLYEYLPKMHALLGGVDDTYEKMYRLAAQTAIDNLLFRPMTPNSDDILFSGELKLYRAKELEAESQHLTCFVGGMFGLGGKLMSIDQHVSIGNKLARGCGWAYHAFPLGIMPEIFNVVACPSLEPCAWDEAKWTKQAAFSDLPKGFKNARDPRYQLRPEAIESIFLLYRMTAAEDLREMAWKMFQSIMLATSTDVANSAIESMLTPEGKTTQKADSMESFWLAETLKYFYLIFEEPENINLDHWVLNTEAHPFKRPE